MRTKDEVESFARLVEQDQRTRYIAEYGTEFPDLVDSACTVTVSMGKKFARVDIGGGIHRSGRYMVDLETGEIFGVKGYGVVHKGWRFGTLDTIHDWNWGDYRAVNKAQTPALVLQS